MEGKMTQNTLTQQEGHWNVMRRWANRHDITLSHVLRLMVEELCDCEMVHDGVFLRFRKIQTGGKS